MCVIILKPAGIELPAVSLLDRAKEANPHGFGLCSPDVHYKGLSYNQFKKNLLNCDINQPVLIHMRYATHGSIKKSNCHPFYSNDVFFMHNGILDIEAYGDKTDSQCAFDDIIMPSINKYGLNSDVTRHVINGIIGYSKFAIMYEDKVSLFGDYIEKDGCYYSNTRFMAYGFYLRQLNGCRALADK